MAVCKVLIKIPIRSLKKNWMYTLKIDIDNPIDLVNEVKQASFKIEYKDGRIIDIDVIFKEFKAGHVYGEATEETIERVEKFFAKTTDEIETESTPKLSVIKGGKE